MDYTTGGWQKEVNRKKRAMVVKLTSLEKGTRRLLKAILNSIQLHYLGLPKRRPLQKISITDSGLTYNTNGAQVATSSG